MPLDPAPLFCSEMCANAERNRSFGECPECHGRWSGNAHDSAHYRNTAWRICNNCSVDLRRCAKCGEPAPA